MPLLAALAAFEICGWHDWKSLSVTAWAILMVALRVDAYRRKRRELCHCLAAISLQERDAILTRLRKDSSPAVRRLAEALRRQLEQAPEVMPAQAPGGDGSEPVPADHRQPIADRIPGGRAPAPP